MVCIGGLLINTKSIALLVESVSGRHHGLRSDVLGQCWASDGAVLGQCWASAGAVLGQCRGSAGPVSGQCWASAMPAD